MAFHRCTIREPDGSLVCEGVSVTVEETAGGDVAWYGTVSVTHTIPLMPGPVYRITLDNGRSGEFTVRRNTMAGGERGTERAVSIFGTGPLS